MLFAVIAHNLRKILRIFSTLSTHTCDSILFNKRLLYLLVTHTSLDNTELFVSDMGLVQMILNDMI